MTYSNFNEGSVSIFSDEHTVDLCKHLLIKDFLVYRATCKLSNALKCEISLYDGLAYELTNAEFIYGLVSSNFNKGASFDKFRVVFDESISDMAIHISNLNSCNEVCDISKKIVSLLVKSSKIENDDDRCCFYLSTYLNLFPNIKVTKLENIKAWLDIREAVCL